MGRAEWMVSILLDGEKYPTVHFFDDGSEAISFFEKLRFGQMKEREEKTGNYMYIELWRLDFPTTWNRKRWY